MVLDVIGQAFAAAEPLLQFGMRDVAGDDQRAGQAQARFDRVLRQRAADLVHWPADINRDYFAAQPGGVDVRKKTRRVGFELFEKHPVRGDLAEDLAVRRA